jgi:uncharacterized protein
MITSLYAGLSGLLLISLSIYVIMARNNFKVSLGYGDNIAMTRRIRAHANLVEFAPLFLILLGFSEYHNLPSWVIHSFGGAFVLGRISHAYSMLKHEKYEGGKLVSKPIWRICGMLITLMSISLLSLINIACYFKV